MCTVVIAARLSQTWPLLLAANRDEMLARPWRPPARHWPDQPDVTAGQDSLGGGTWLGLNDAGLLATILNRTGSLGPAAGKRSRGELPLLALRHRTAALAAAHLATLPATSYRSFNLLLADRHTAHLLCNTGAGPITAHRLPPGLHMITAQDLDDPASPRIARHLPRFRAAPLPNPPDWTAWQTLLADTAGPRDAALHIPPAGGFGTVTSTLVGLGAGTVFLSTAPGSDAFT